MEGSTVREKEYVAKDFSYLIGTLGFSENLLKNHFTLYQGYVANTQKVRGLLGELLNDRKEDTPGFAELKRRFGWEWNGMRLHELYFENLGGNGDASSAPRALEIIKTSFGSLDVWEREFRATGMMRGVGWVTLYLDAATKSAFNCWINEHDVAHLAGCTPLVVMDVFEHAFMLDYGLKRADYISAFMGALDWAAVEKRIS